MADFAAEEIASKVQRGEKFERADLRGIQLPNAILDRASFRRCDLDGANLDGAQLRGATFKNVSLRNASLVGADLRDADLDNADLEGANLEGANLSAANLNRANLQRANLSTANLSGARLRYAQLDGATLRLTDLTSAAISYAELVACNLQGAALRKADLTSSNLRSANVDEADFTDAVLKHIQLSQASGRKAKFVKASLTKADLSEADLTGADLSEADARDADVTHANLTSVILTGAKIAGLVTKGTTVDRLTADWVDTSSGADGSRRVHGDKVTALLKEDGPVEPTSGEAAPRYFGRGDILRNASLQIEEGAYVEIESVFEECSISLGRGAELVIGHSGVLSGCKITGDGTITIHGHFFERENPGIAGVKQLVVSSTGALVGAVEQPAESTRFAFEPGCRLRMKILEVESLGESAPSERRTGNRSHPGPFSEKTTIVEEGTHFNGSMATQSPLVVMGKFEGSISAPSLIVSEGGSVHGKVKVGRMTSEGELSGEFDADIVLVSGVVKSHTTVRAKSIDAKLAAAGGSAGVRFGDCVLDIGDAPSREAALAASLRAAARERAQEAKMGSRAVGEHGMSMAE
jgi:uncharacterized protein YjbI with pentapeptide repeats/cytoskeletal protein CcmA (bactofilin family)